MVKMTTGRTTASTSTPRTTTTKPTTATTPPTTTTTKTTNRLPLPMLAKVEAMNSSAAAAILMSTTSNSSTASHTTAATPTATDKTPATMFDNLSTAVAAGAQNKRATIIIYPTVTPESVVIPIVSCILGFPLLALLVICCLRRRAKLARERDRRRNYDLQDHAVSLVRFSPIHRLTGRSTRPICLRSERGMNRAYPSLELDTVLEERSDYEQPTQTDQLTPESSTVLPTVHNDDTMDTYS